MGVQPAARLRQEFADAHGPDSVPLDLPQPAPPADSPAPADGSAPSDRGDRGDDLDGFNCADCARPFKTERALASYRRTAHTQES
ncbi:hypothetical protein CW362_19950 [Streptomyces populi]|uniref:C2H2-type domain-containing protein n=1 Tax=Streptomyces populi TaxID=2058924 RepID=A0A2I0SN23_9ACTN|nr:hypothetical protein [Streptomyces populi]PKT71317.1 hypothetical protein CW362_19950 [Streptomyces populi]